MDEEVLAVELTLLEKGDSSYRKFKSKTPGKEHLVKDPILGSRGGAFNSSWETRGGIEQGLASTVS